MKPLVHFLKHLFWSALWVLGVGLGVIAACFVQVYYGDSEMSFIDKHLALTICVVVATIVAAIFLYARYNSKNCLDPDHT
ncbi:MAG: hypothetical protein ABR875_03585 [Minisyncoccia bacterium]